MSGKLAVMLAAIALFGMTIVTGQATAQNWSPTSYCYDVCIQKCKTAVAIGTHFKSMSACIAHWSRENRKQAQALTTVHANEKAVGKPGCMPGSVC
jgi:hypothetical protein